MKRFLCLLLTAALLLTATGCDWISDPSATDGSENATSEAVPSTGTEPAETEPTVTPTEPPLEIQEGDVVINEAMPDNKYLCLGHDYDWIELYNAEEYDIDLTGYYLTDDLTQPYALPLAGLTVAAESYLVITLEEESAFHLSAKGETVYLVCGDSILSELTFGETDSGVSVDQNGACQYPTPGYANTQEGYLCYLDSLTLSELIISEVISSNSKHNAVNGSYYDMVEVQNISDYAIDLSEYCLTDKRSDMERYRFPNVTLEPGEFFIVYCSGDTALGSSHASFKISADGETVYLSKNGVYVDAMTVPGDLAKNESYGRDGKIPSYFATPTFGAENGEGYLTGLAAPTADVASGLYDQAVTVTLTGEGTVYYTTDGTCPTTSSAVYTGPITVTGVTTIRTFCVSNGRTSSYSAYTYVIGAEHSLPVVVISIPQDSLTGEAGVLNNTDKDYEYQAMLTLIEDGEEKFSVPFGFCLHGNDSRKGAKQNFSLRFRSEYGVGKLNYALFDGLDIDEFDSLLLKGGSEDFGSAMMRDEMATAVAADTNVYTQAMKPVVLYLGGEYWGVYYFRERYSDDYVASHLDVDADSVDLVTSTNAVAQAGSNKDFLALRTYCENHDMSLDENYAYLESQIDVLSLIDWYILRSYMGDRDLANIRRFRSSEDDGKWHWMYFDLDWCFYHTGRAFFSTEIKDPNGDRTLMLAVIANAQGRELFLTRCRELLETVLNEEYIVGVIDSIYEQIAPEMARDRERWGYSLSKWESNVQKLRNYVADGVRTQGFLEDVQSYFGLTDAEMEQYFAGLL